METNKLLKNIEYDFLEMKKVADKYNRKKAVLSSIEWKLNNDMYFTLGGDVWAQVVAVVHIPLRGGEGFKLQEISSSGVWGLNSGIEIDSEIFEIEEADLLHYLKILNVATDLYESNGCTITV